MHRCQERGRGSQCTHTLTHRHNKQYKRGGKGERGRERAGVARRQDCRPYGMSRSSSSCSKMRGVKKRRRESMGQFSCHRGCCTGAVVGCAVVEGAAYRSRIAVAAAVDR